MRFSSGGGFTLLELIIAVAILGIVSAVVYSSFRTIMLSLEDARNMHEASSRAEGVIWHMSFELGNAFADEELDFAGYEGEEFDELIFYTTAVYPRSEDGGPYRVSYTVSENQLWKSVEDRVFKLADGIEGFKLRFYAGGSWSEEWEAPGTGRLPAACEIEFETGGRKHSRVVLLPASGNTFRGGYAVP